MSEAAERTVKSTQEQAVASWIMFLNQRRLEILIDRLNQQDINLEESLNELNEIKKFIEDAEHILGNASTKHGEIAEVMQVRIANARRLIKGLARNHSFEGVGRTAPEDYMRNGKQVQSKFYNGLRNTLFGKHALAEHLEKYRDFTKNGGSYDIPKDQYEEMVDLLNKYHTDPKQLSRSEYNLAKKIDEFLKSKGLELGKDIKPSVVNYSDVQQGNANKTVEKEEENIKKEDEKQQQEQAKLAMEQLPSNVDELEQGAFESEDDYILAKMAMAEAEDQDTEGKALVIRVILNRVEDEHFPDTIKGVVSQKNAFTPYWNGRYKKVKPDADCYNALILVKKHDWDKSQGATYFEMTSGSTWHTRNLKRLFKHGCHTFYKEK